MRALNRSIRPLTTALLALGLAAGAVPTGYAQPGRPAVTDAQRETAARVAEAGVPLSALAPDAPDAFTVRRGDTLWSIATVFLRSPWRWPELWGMNKEQIANPHLIFPGQQLRLVKANGRARLEVAGESNAVPGAAQPVDGPPGELVRLTPRVRDVTDGAGAIGSIPANVIEPFLARPRVVGAGELAGAARIVGTQEGRLFLGRGDTAYAKGLAEGAGPVFVVLRPERPLYDPDDTNRRNPIAYEAFYVGTARLTRPGDPASLRVLDSVQEVGVDDRLIDAGRTPLLQYVPRRPEQPIAGRVVSIYDGVQQAGSQQIVTLNRGQRDGVAIGHVFSLLETGATVPDRTVAGSPPVKLPDESIGNLFVFRVFDGISYALVMRLTKPVKVGDRFAAADPD